MPASSRRVRSRTCRCAPRREIRSAARDRYGWRGRRDRRLERRTQQGRPTSTSSRVSFTGTPLWTPGTVYRFAPRRVISLYRESSRTARAVRSSPGSTLGPGNDIYAQRVNAAGVAQWTPNRRRGNLRGRGQSVGSRHGLGRFRVARLSRGEMVVLGPTGSSRAVFAQRVNASGALQWPVVAICTAASQQSLPAIA